MRVRLTPRGVGRIARVARVKSDAMTFSRGGCAVDWWLVRWRASRGGRSFVVARIESVLRRARPRAKAVVARRWAARFTQGSRRIHGRSSRANRCADLACEPSKELRRMCASRGASTCCFARNPCKSLALRDEAVRSANSSARRRVVLPQSNSRGRCIRKFGVHALEIMRNEPQSAKL